MKHVVYLLLGCISAFAGCCIMLHAQKRTGQSHYSHPAMPYPTEEISPHELAHFAATHIFSQRNVPFNQRNMPFYGRNTLHPPQNVPASYLEYVRALIPRDAGDILKRRPVSVGMMIYLGKKTRQLYGKTREKLQSRTAKYTLEHPGPANNNAGDAERK